MGDDWAQPHTSLTRLWGAPGPIDTCVPMCMGVCMWACGYWHRPVGLRVHLHTCEVSTCLHTAARHPPHRDAPCGAWGSFCGAHMDLTACPWIQGLPSPSHAWDLLPPQRRERKRSRHLEGIIQACSPPATLLSGKFLRFPIAIAANYTSAACSIPMGACCWCVLLRLLPCAALRASGAPHRPPALLPLGSGSPWCWVSDLCGCAGAQWGLAHVAPSHGAGLRVQHPHTGDLHPTRPWERILWMLGPADPVGCVYMCVCAHVFICMCACVCMHAHASVCTCVCLYMHMYGFM